MEQHSQEKTARLRGEGERSRVDCVFREGWEGVGEVRERAARDAAVVWSEDGLGGGKTRVDVLGSTYTGRVAASRASLSLRLDLPREESLRCLVV